MSEVAAKVAPIAVDDGAVTILVDGRPVTVDRPPSAQWRRGPGDVIRLLVALLAALAAGAVLEWGRGTAGGLQDDVLAVEPDLPGFLLQVIYGVYAVLLLALPVLLLVWVITRRHWRLLGLYLATTLMTSIGFDLLGGWITDRLPAPPAGADPSAVVTLLDLSQDFGWVAGFAAALTVTRPWVPIKWYRLGWVLLLGLIPARLLLGAGAPSGRLFAMAAGWAIGSLALLVVGTPSQAPSAASVVRGLSSSGIRLLSLRRAGVDARGSTPYFAEAEDGRRYFVKVLGKDERNADLLFRVYRYLRLRNVGDEEPFSSLRRAVEHEAMTSVWAERAGVRTPDMAACTELEDGSMALAYGLVKGRSIDAVAPEELTDEFLRGMWGQVRILREARIAHRDLRSANVFMTADGAPMMIDFGFGEVSASDELLDQDVAQLILSTAIDVGPQRAVAAAVEVLGPQAVAASAPRMQAPALSGATQAALRKHKGLLDETREEVKAQTGIDTIELAKLERANAKTILTVVMAFGVLWFLIPQIAELPRLTAQLREADWTLAAVAVGFSLLTYVGSALSMASSVAQRIPVIRATMVALAGSFVNRVSPAKVGGMALNLRFLQKSGVSTSVASASIGLYSVVGAITHVTLLVIFSVWAGRTVNLAEFLPGPWVIIAVVGVLLGVIGVLVFVPKLRGFIAEKVRPEAVKVRANLRALLERPVRLVLIVAGSALLSLSYIGALDASLRAFDAQIALPIVAVIYLAGASIASAAPTPGGVGAVEAALIGGLTAAGVPSEIAIPGVFLYRLATFWIPVLPGWGAFSWLQRREYV
jgi:undecaprenyl-diphosphatase